MLREQYSGLTYFSAAHVAGLFMHPEIGSGPACTRGRDLYYDPELSPAEQRGQIIHEIAVRRAAGPEGGDVADYEQQLDAELLQC